MTAPIRRDRWAAALARRDPAGAIHTAAVLVVSLLFVPLAAALVVGRAWLVREPWRDLGFVQPRRWLGAILAGVALGLGLKLLMKSLVHPLLGFPAVNPANAFLVGDPTAAVLMGVYVVIGAAFCEEVVFRGFLFHRLGGLLGVSARGSALTLAASSLLFAVAHWPLGWLAIANALIGGLLFGALYLATRRTIWIPIIAHAVFDLFSVWIIYSGLERNLYVLFFPAAAS